MKSNNKKDLAHSYLASVRNDEFALYRLITEDNRVGRKIRDWLNIDENSIKKESGIDEGYFDKELFSKIYQMRKPNHKWYNLDGKTNTLEALCHRLEMDEYYNLIYRIFSKEVRSKNVMKLFQIEQENLVGLGITVDEKLHDSIISFYLLNSIRDVYKEYGMKKELTEFNTIVSIITNIKGSSRGSCFNQSKSGGIIMIQETLDNENIRDIINEFIKED